MGVTALHAYVSESIFLNLLLKQIQHAKELAENHNLIIWLKLKDVLVECDHFGA